MGSSSTANSDVHPTLDVPIAPGQNAILCASFKLAFDALAEALGGRVSLAHDPPLVVELEASAITADDLDAASFVAQAGEGPRFRDALARELTSRFGDRDDFMLPEALPAGALLAYAYLSKDLAFATPFDADRREGLTFQGRLVSCFGIWEEDEQSAARRKQVRICHDGAPDDFVLELATKGTGDRLIIARTSPQPTLLETVRVAIEHVTAKPSFFERALGRQQLGKDDVVQIPMVAVERTRVFEELEGPLSDGERLVDKALMRVRMQLDESGAILRSAGMIMVPRGGRGPRMFVCDGPFLIAMIREGRELPYFAGWIDNVDVLEPIEAP